MTDKYTDAYDLMMFEGKHPHVCKRARCGERTLRRARSNRDLVGEVVAARITEAMIYYGYLSTRTRVEDLFPRHVGVSVLYRQSLSELWASWVGGKTTGIETIRGLSNSKNITTSEQARIVLHNMGELTS